MSEYTQEEINESQKTVNTVVLTCIAKMDAEMRWLWRITIFNLICCIVLLFASSAKSAEFSKIEAEYGIPHNLLRAICKVETNLERGALNSNDAGSPSYGVCQVKEVAARQVGWDGWDIMELLYGESEIYYAAKYLRYQYLRYNKDWVSAIAAYNAGHLKFNRDGQLLNHNYVRRVWNACQTLGCQMKSLSLGPVIYPQKRL